jgi:YidC/Oxa1 family membrane protein insertase
VLSFLNPLYVAVAWVIVHIHAMLAVPFGADSGLAWGLSIVLLVLLLRIIMLPLFVKQVKSQQRMQQHMPQLQEIRRKYKNDKQRLNEETMKYYKENGVNPLGGCLPLLAQFPVFIALFNVLRAVADGHTQFGLTPAVLASARHAHVFGVLLSDKFLFQHPPAAWSVRVVILVAVLISACTTFLTMRQSQKRGMLQQGAPEPDPDNPMASSMAQSQKFMVYIAPLFALSGLYWQFGLVIYWVTNNLWTMGQQHFLFRNLPVVGSATVSGATAPASGAKNAAASTAKASAGSRPGQAGKASTAGRAAGSSASQSARPAAGRPAGSAAGQASAAKPAKPAQPAAKAGVNGSSGGSAASASSANASPAGDQGGGLSGLLRLGKGKAGPEPEVVEPAKATVRQQPVRQTRSKRSGNKR